MLVLAVVRQTKGGRASVTRSVNGREAAFLILLFLGTMALVGGLLWTRLHWRADLAPYGRQTRWLDVALHPERYAKLHALHVIRTLNLTGALLVASAFGILAYEAFRSFAGR